MTIAGKGEFILISTGETICLEIVKGGMTVATYNHRVAAFFFNPRLANSSFVNSDKKQFDVCSKIQRTVV